MANPFAAQAFTDAAGAAQTVLGQAPASASLATTADMAYKSLGATAGTASQTLNQLAPTPQFGWGSYFQAIAVIFLLLAVLAFAFYLLKRFAPRAGVGIFKRGDLQLEGQLSLGPKRSVVVVRFLNKRLVLGVAESQINLLTQVDADHAPAKQDFSQALEQIQDSLDTPRT